MVPTLTETLKLIIFVVPSSEDIYFPPSKLCPFNFYVCLYHSLLQIIDHMMMITFPVDSIASSTDLLILKKIIAKQKEAHCSIGNMPHCPGTRLTKLLLNFFIAVACTLSRNSIGFACAF